MHDVCALDDDETLHALQWTARIIPECALREVIAGRLRYPFLRGLLSFPTLFCAAERSR